MNFRHKSNRLICTLLLTAGSIQAAPNYSRMYVFGDSYSDNGAGYVDGNGPTAVVYLAEKLGITLLPSTAPNSAGKSLNFAVSGAGTGVGAGRKVKDVMLGRGMHDQVDDFVARVQSGTAVFDPKTTLFFIAGGLNDKRLTSDVTVQNLKLEITTLYRAGARNFRLALLPTAIPGFSEVGKRLNPELEKIPAAIAKELPGISITLSNWGPFFDEVMNNPTRYGIQNTTAACAGRAIYDEDTTPCPAPATFYYYHAGHPSTAVHKIVGEKLYQEIQR